MYKKKEGDKRGIQYNKKYNPFESSF